MPKFKDLHDHLPVWARWLVRLATALLNAALWLGLWLAVFLSIFWLILQVGSADWVATLGSTAHLLLKWGLRLTLLGLFGLWVVLMIHPVRMRWWLVRKLGWAFTWRQRARLRARQPADGQPAAAPPPAPAAAPSATSADSAPRRGPQLLAQPPRPMSRRRFLAESVLLGGLIGYSMLVEPEQIQVMYVDLPVPQLPARFHGLRIAQVSDLHVNAYTTADDIAEAVHVINQLDADIVTITGDFVDWNARFAEDATRPFRQLRAREGVFSILGNHDYYSGNIDLIKATIRRHDLGLLVNEHTVLRRGADALTLIGLDDPRHNRGGGLRYNRESVDPERAMRGVLAERPRVLLVHNPVIVSALLRRYELDVILSGHTHGGQFQVPIITDSLFGANEYFVHGRYDLGRTQVYVNRGLGFTGPPVRFRARPEVTLARLVPAAG